MALRTMIVVINVLEGLGTTPLLICPNERTFEASRRPWATEKFGCVLCQHPTPNLVGHHANWKWVLPLLCACAADGE